jgi:hypothetical protein
MKQDPCLREPWKDISAPPRPVRWVTPLLACLVLFQSSAAAGAFPALPIAQFDDFAPPPSEYETDWELWVKVAILAVIVFATYMSAYFIVFPMRLRSGNPPWPMSLYGRCNAGAWFIWVTAALVIFFNELEWNPDEPTALGRYGLRIGMGVLAVGGALIWLFAFRSEGQREST